MPHLQDSTGNLAAAAQVSEPQSNEENVRHQSQIGQDLWKQMKRVSILISGPPLLLQILLKFSGIII